MAYLTITRIHGETGELLAAHREHGPTMAEVGRDHGLIVHTAAGAEEGLVVVNLWPSRDGSEAAARDPRRAEVVARLGLTPDRIRPRHYDGADYEVFSRRCRARSPSPARRR